MNSSLTIGDDGGGPRHFLDGRPVHCGTQLRLCVAAGVPEDRDWVWARYEASFRGDTISPVLYTVFGRVLPDPDTRLRWPTEAER